MQVTRSLARCHKITVFFLLFSQIIGTKAACIWNGAGCLLQCITSTSVEVITQIEELYATREECHTNGVLLRLNRLTYPNNTIPSHWFTADIKVDTMEVSLSGVESVSPDAFNANAFQTVTKLTFTVYELSLMRNGIFNGLDQLEIINIKSAGSVDFIEKGVLDTLTELKEFTFEQSLPRNHEISINGLTGSESLSKLENVTIKYNLTNSLKTSTFIGLTNVKRLVLSSCQIKYIEDNTFDPISETIEELDLSKNLLTTVSYGVFSMSLPNIKTIRINENSWHCDCELFSFRSFVEQYQDNVLGFSCSSPSECRVVSMEAECFKDCETPTTTTSAVTTTTTTTSTTTTMTTTTSPDADLIIQCHNEIAVPDTLASIKRPIGSMTIDQNDHGDIILTIDSDSDSLVIIWFDEYRNSGEIGEDEDVNCIMKNGITSIPLTNLTNDIIYTFCLMDKTSSSVSPFDCTSYVRHDDQTIWLFESSKTLTVTLIAISLALNVVVGMAIGYWMVNCNPFSNHSNQMSRFSIENNVKDRTSNVYTRNTPLTINSVYNDTFKCPPLPERPARIFEEPVYASVEEK